MRQIITDDFGQMKLDSKLLPGTFEAMEITGDIVIDEVEVPGQSGKAKQAMGFGDAVISLKLRLPTDDESTAYEKLEQLNAIFQAVDAQAKPYVYRIVNKHTAARKVNQVIFKTLRSSEDNRSDLIKAELEFTEYRPIVVKKEAMAPPETPPKPLGLGDLRLSDRDAEKQASEKRVARLRGGLASDIEVL